MTYRTTSRTLLSVAISTVVGLLVMPPSSGVGAADETPFVEVSETLPTRYLVELAPGEVPVAVKLDHPDVEQIVRDAIADFVADEVEALGGEVVHDYVSQDYVVVSAGDPNEIVNLPGVASVRAEEFVYRSLTTTLDVINAQDSDLDGALSGVRADGSGWAVAVIDDGIDRTHPSFMRADGTSRVIAEACRTRGYCPGNTEEYEGVGAAAHFPGDSHGTHVTGIAAGDSRGTSSIAPRGVARAADIVAVQVFNPDGGASFVDIDRALQWVLARKLAGVPIASVNMSLGAGLWPSTCDSYWPTTKPIIDQLQAEGVVIAVASGNDGATSGMSWPACISNVIPVGSSNDNDTVSYFSNVSSLLVTNGVMAPGSGVCSAVSRDWYSVGYDCWSGTSMATPHVAGAVALLRQAKPNATITEIKTALRTTPTTISDTRRNPPRTGLRRMDVSTALGVFATPGGAVRGTVSDASSSPSTALANTQLLVAMAPTGTIDGRVAFSTSVTTDGSGEFTLSNVLVGDWSATVSALGYTASAPVTFTVANGQVVYPSFATAAMVGDISGTVTGISLPANVTFALEPGTGSLWTSTNVTQSLDASGAFVLAGVRAGPWRLTAQSGTAISATVDLTVTDGATVSAGSLTLAEPVGSFVGVATNEQSGAVLANTTLSLTASPVGDPSDRAPFSTSITTGADGSFSLPAVRIGNWSVSVSASSFLVRSESVLVQNGQSTTVSATLTPQPGAIGGIVIDGGLVESASVTPSGSLTGSITLDLRPTGAADSRVAISRTASFAASGGTYTVTNIQPGDWSALATVFGFVPTMSAVTVLPGQTSANVDFVLDRRTAVAGVNPQSGITSGGETVTITGLHLTSASAVTFGGTPGTIQSVAADGTSVVVRTPSKAAGTVPVIVTTPLGASTDVVNFTFSTPYVPVDTPSGGGGGGGGGGAPSPASVQVIPGSGGSTVVQLGLAFGTVRLNFSNLSGPGSVTVTPKAGVPPFNSGGVVLPGYWLDISSSTGSFGSVEVCAPIETQNLSSLGLSVGQLRLFHWENNVRKDVTTRVDTANNRICGTAESFSPFAVGALKTQRVAGEDRYETAAKLSAASFTPGVAVAYVVTGEKFPDALAAGAAAGREGGPVLLARLNALPAVTVNELKRVAPRRVIVVGGTAVISDAVVASIRAALPGVPVERVAGEDRFETAAKLSQRTFSAANGTVYLGSGVGFTEILAGAAAAGRDKSPLLLLPGTGPNAGLPLTVAVELKRLNPRTVVILGGSGLVAPGAVDAVRRIVPNASIDQIGGVDAYDTAAKVARRFVSGGTVYVATGAVFADGLAGGAAAATRGHPMVMVPASGTLPTPVTQALAQLRPARIIVLGGTAAIARDIENAVAGYLP